MTVYVDNQRIRYGWMRMSHLLADTSEELREMACALDLRPYIQHSGTWKEHLDVSQGKRALAIRLGAVPVTVREIVAVARIKRGGA